MDRLQEIKARQYPNGNTIQMISDIEWLIDQVEYLRESRGDWRGMTLHGSGLEAMRAWRDGRAMARENAALLSKRKD